MSYFQEIGKSLGQFDQNALQQCTDQTYRPHCTKIGFLARIFRIMTIFKIFGDHPPFRSSQYFFIYSLESDYMFVVGSQYLNYYRYTLFIILVKYHSVKVLTFDILVYLIYLRYTTQSCIQMWLPIIPQQTKRYGSR